MTLTLEQVAELRKLADKATPGPYTVDADVDMDGRAENFAIHGEQYDWVCNTDNFSNSRYLQKLEPATIKSLCDLAEEALKRRAAEKMHPDYYAEH